MAEHGVAGTGRVGGWPRGGAERDLAAYRRLAVQLHHDVSAQGRRSVLVVSPTDGRVAARSAAVLACCAAEQLGEPVLLVDAAAADPVLSRMLGCVAGPGLADVGGAAAGRDASDATPPSWGAWTHGTSAPGVRVLGAGRADGSGSGLRPAAAESFVRKAEGGHGLVVLSGGAVLREASGLVFAAEAGCVLLAVVEHRTRVRDLREAQESLVLSRATRVGLLMTSGTRRRFPLAGA